LADQAEILISVVIVNYKVPETLRQALHSLREADQYPRTEVIVVDNASNDNSRAIVAKDFPEVAWIQLKSNIGFGKACNVGAKHAHGEYLLILNPDTIIGRTTLTLAVEYLRAHPEIGLLGPKLLKSDGTLQPGCRRGFPTPQAAFYHFAGFSRLFPKSKRFGHYNLTYLDPDSSYEVDAISGSFMFLRHTLFESIGGFDEQFFMYGEDLDLCRRIKDAGFKIWYFPEMRVIHLKGKSSAKRLLRSRIAFYEAMFLFSKKYQRQHSAYIPGWVIYLGIAFQAAVNIASKLVQVFTASLIDLALINLSLVVSIYVRFWDHTEQIPYYSHRLILMIGVHALLSVSFLTMFAYNGIYIKKKYSVSNLLLSVFFASVLFMACIYCIQSIAYSRLAFAGALALILVLLIGWRELLPRLLHALKQVIYRREKVIIVGNGVIPRMVIQNLERQKTASIVGILATGAEGKTGEFEGYSILGNIEEVAGVLERMQVDVLLIATDVPWYSFIIEALSKSKARNLTIRWVPHEMFEKKIEELPPVIPLHDFSV
jgi:O-antigen biosynthesis protein